MKLSDGYSRPKFNIAGAMEWLCFRLDMLSLIPFVFSLIFLISIPVGLIDPGVLFQSGNSLQIKTYSANVIRN